MSATTNSDVPKPVDPNPVVLEGIAPYGSSSQQGGEDRPLSPTASDDGFDYRFVPLELFADSTLNDLADGFLECFLPELAKTLESFQELRTHQAQMLSVTEDLNEVSQTPEMAKEVSETLQQVPLYREKLVSVVKQMNSINKRVARLNQRAQKLKEHRIAADEQKRRSEEKRKVRERLLEAKPAHK